MIHCKHEQRLSLIQAPSRQAVCFFMLLGSCLSVVLFLSRLFLANHWLEFSETMGAVTNNMHYYQHIPFHKFLQLLTFTKPFVSAIISICMYRAINSNHQLEFIDTIRNFTHEMCISIDTLSGLMIFHGVI